MTDTSNSNPPISYPTGTWTYKIFEKYLKDTSINFVKTTPANVSGLIILMSAAIALGGQQLWTSTSERDEILAALDHPQSTGTATPVTLTTNLVTALGLHPKTVVALRSQIIERKDDLTTLWDAMFTDLPNNYDGTGTHCPSYDHLLALAQRVGPLPSA